MFQDIKFQWAGKTYILPARKSLGGIAVVENTITLQELAKYSQNGLAPRGKLAIAFGDLLRYCGAEVTNEEIYVGMFGTEEDVVSAVGTAVATLMQLMIPPDAMARLTRGEGGQASVKGRGEADPPAGNSPATAAKPSKRTSARRSAESGSSTRQSSGRSRR